mmetsp:Transcript_10098/g.25300  ORF Transcript_10098/g.25300 Transcript_10098/m.25300 type:complete len:253 (-) Transcript_10098:79-837(-)
MRRLLGDVIKDRGEGVGHHLLVDRQRGRGDTVGELHRKGARGHEEVEIRAALRHRKGVAVRRCDRGLPVGERLGERAHRAGRGKVRRTSRVVHQRRGHSARRGPSTAAPLNPVITRDRHGVAHANDFARGGAVVAGKSGRGRARGGRHRAREGRLEERVDDVDHAGFTGAGEGAGTELVGGEDRCGDGFDDADVGRGEDGAEVLGGARFGGAEAGAGVLDAVARARSEDTVTEGDLREGGRDEGAEAEGVED